MNIAAEAPVTKQRRRISPISLCCAGEHPAERSLRGPIEARGYSAFPAASSATLTERIGARVSSRRDRADRPLLEPQPQLALPEQAGSSTDA